MSKDDIAVNLEKVDSILSNISVTGDSVFKMADARKLLGQLFGIVYQELDNYDKMKKSYEVLEKELEVSINEKKEWDKDLPPESPKTVSRH